MVGVIILLGSCSTPAPAPNARRGLFDQVEPGRYFEKSASSEDRFAGQASVEIPGVESGHWSWPLRENQVNSDFGWRKRRFHQGIDLKAGVGTPVYAVRDGEVVYSASKVKGYGRMVLLKHADGYFSVYAHNSKNLVKKGQQVTQGQKIALSGRSGRAHGAHLHFEIRKGTLAINPLKILPDSPAATAQVDDSSELEESDVGMDTAEPSPRRHAHTKKRRRSGG